MVNFSITLKCISFAYFYFFIIFLFGWMSHILHTLSVLIFARTNFAHSRKNLKNARKLVQLLRANGVCAKINTREK